MGDLYPIPRVPQVTIAFLTANGVTCGIDWAQGDVCEQAAQELGKLGTRIRSTSQNWPQIVAA